MYARTQEKTLFWKKQHTLKKKEALFEKIEALF
jgi:hypothetical protein